MPAQAGIQSNRLRFAQGWIPAFAGMTMKNKTLVNLVSLVVHILPSSPRLRRTGRCAQNDTA
jgi:hypothetical protein